MRKFEYRVLFLDVLTSGQMDALGASGWELVSAINNDNSRHYKLIFKREVSSGD